MHSIVLCSLCSHSFCLHGQHCNHGSVSSAAPPIVRSHLLYRHSWSQKCGAEEEKAAAEAEAAAAAREATPEVSEEGEIAVDPEELEEISKAQQQAVSKQAHPRSPASKQASDRGRERDRDRGLDRDKGHPGRDRQVPFVLVPCAVFGSVD